jgi:hypothetical protein
MSDVTSQQDPDHPGRWLGEGRVLEEDSSCSRTIFVDEGRQLLHVAGAHCRFMRDDALLR